MEDSRKKRTLAVIHSFGTVNAFSVWKYGVFYVYIFMMNRNYADKLLHHPDLHNIHGADKQKYFLDYVGRLRKRRDDEKQQIKEEAMIKFRNLLKTLPITVDTTWHAAFDIFSTTALFQSDPVMKEVDMADLLVVFEDHIHDLQRRWEMMLKVDQNEAIHIDIEHRREFKVQHILTFLKTSVLELFK